MKIEFAQVLNAAVAPDQHHDADDDPWQQRAPELRLGQRRLVHRLRRRPWSRPIRPAAQRRRQPELLRLPDLQEQDQAAHRDQRGADIDDPGIDVVRDHELRDRERHAGDQNGRPDVLHALPAGERPDHPERHDQREHRQLPSDHRAENIGIETGDRGETLDRRAERAIGDRRGVGDQRQAGGGERREAEADQDRAGDRDRRAEARGAFEERAERKRDQQQLQPPVLGDAADGALQQFESAGRNRDAGRER